MNRNSVLTRVDCRTNANANLNLGTMADIDIGDQVLGVGFCRKIFILNTLALTWHFYMKRRVRQGNRAKGLIAEMQKKSAIWDPKDALQCNRGIKYWWEIVNQLNVEGLYKENKIHLVKLSNNIWLIKQS